MSRKLGLTIGISVVFLIAAISVAPLLLGPTVRRFQPLIESQLGSMLGAPVKYASFDARIFPSAGIELHDFSVTPTQEKTPSLSAQKLLLGTGLFDLLRGRLDIRYLELKSASLRIVRDADGKTSLAGIHIHEKSAAPMPKQSSATPSAADANHASASLAVHIGKIDVSDTNIQIIDQSTHSPVEIRADGIKLSASDLGGSGNGKISFQATLVGSLSAEVQGNGALHIENLKEIPRGEILTTISDIDLAKLQKVAAQYTSLPAELSLASHAALTFTTRLSPEGISILPKLDATGSEISLGTIVRKPSGEKLALSVEGRQLPNKSIELKNALLSLGKAEVAAEIFIEPSGESKGTWEIHSLPLESLSLSVPPAKNLQVQGEIKGGGSFLSTQSQLTVNGPVEAQNLEATVAISSSKSSAPSLHIHNGNFKIVFDGKSAKLNDASLVVGNSLVHLQTSASPLTRPAITFAVDSETFNLDDVFSALDTASMNPASLRGLHLEGNYRTEDNTGNAQLSLAGGTLARSPLTASTITVTQKKDSTELKPSTIGIFGGTTTMSASLTHGLTEILNSQVTAQQLDLSAISRALLATAPIKINGTLRSLRAQLEANMKSARQTASGSISFDAGPGSIEGFGLIGKILSQVKDLPGVSGALASNIPEKYRDVLLGNATAFDSLQGQVQVRNEALYFDQISLNHSLYSLSGSGQVSFLGTAKLRVDMKLTPLLTADMVKRNSELRLLLDSQGNLVFPVVIEHSQDSTIVIPDVSKLLQSAVKNRASDAAAKAIGKVAPGLSGKASKVLNSLFK